MSILSRISTLKIEIDLKTKLKTLSVLSIVLFSINGLAETPTTKGLMVITRTDTPIAVLSKRQIKSVYLGAPTALKLTPIMLESSTLIRQQFNAEVMGLSESRLQSFLAQMRFSGRAVNLVELDDIEQVLKQVIAEPNFIAYVPSDTKLGSNVKVLFTRP